MCGVFAWEALLKAGLYSLRLKPEEFWALTPVELRLMLGVDEVQGPMTRAGLAALENMYPDKSMDGNDEKAKAD